MKEKGKTITSPMDGSTIGPPQPGGEFGTGLDFADQPHEGISGHNVYESPEKSSFTGKGKSKLVSPTKAVRPVKIDE